MRRERERERGGRNEEEDDYNNNDNDNIDNNRYNIDNNDNSKNLFVNPLFDSSISFSFYKTLPSASLFNYSYSYLTDDENS